MFKYRGIILTVILISAISFVGYRSEKKIDQIIHKIEKTGSSEAQSLEGRVADNPNPQEQAAVTDDVKDGSKQENNVQNTDASLKEGGNVLTPSQVEEIVKSYLLQNPQVISDALDKLQHMKMEEMRKQIQSGIADHKTELEHSSSPEIGNKEGKSIVVMFYDYNCGYCRQAADAINSFLHADDNAKVILKAYPILGGESEYLARISIAVYAKYPEKFHEVHYEILSGSLSDKAALEDFFAKNKINAQEIAKIADSEEVTNQIKNNIKLAKELKITGVPAFIINGNYYPGFLSAEQLIERAKVDLTPSDNKEDVGTNNTKE